MINNWNALNKQSEDKERWSRMDKKNKIKRENNLKKKKRKRR